MVQLRSDPNARRESAAIPKLDGGAPLIGNLWEFQRDPIAMLTRGRRALGELYQFRLGTRQFSLFGGPDAHDAFFNAPEDQLSAKAVYQFTVPIFGKGVAYDAAPEVMDEQLGFLYPALREAAMQRFARIMYEETAQLADSLGDEGVLDLPEAMNQLTVNIASRSLIGQEVRDQVDAGFADAYHDLQRGINTLGFFLPYLPTPAHRSRDRARKRISAIFAAIMAERRRSGAYPDDFMQSLMDASYSDGRRLSDDEIAGILLTVLFAGQHTSGVLATWVGLELIRAQSYLQRLRDETASVYGATGRMELDGLKQQTLMEYAVRECERLHPPLILLVRKVLRPMTYRGYEVPAGSMAMVSPAMSHRLPEVFEDPDRFNPDRFAPPASEDKAHHYTLIGFGGGKHRCMGKHFAEMQVKAIWTVLLDAFEFTPVSTFPSPNYGSWVTGPELPCRVRYRRRQHGTILQ